MLSSKSYPLSCCTSSSPPPTPLSRTLDSTTIPRRKLLLPLPSPTHGPPITLRLGNLNPRVHPIFHPQIGPNGRRDLFLLHIRRSSIDRREPNALPPSPENDWTTSVLLFGLWAALMFYVFQLTPNQTPYRDAYFLQKLLNLRGDDGFEMNPVLVALWYIMGLWPLVYSMLLIPSARSSKSKVPVWPFLVLSCIGGAYALIPYFVLWKPPPPAVKEDEINRWPLNFLESKIAAGVSLAAGLGLIAFAGLSSGEAWKEFYQYFRESKFIHVTCIDFSLLSTFAPFWVYNDMTSRRWINDSSWLLPVSLIPFLGPTLYILFRPPLSALPMSTSSATAETEKAE